MCEIRVLHGCYICSNFKFKVQTSNQTSKKIFKLSREYPNKHTECIGMKNSRLPFMKMLTSFVGKRSAVDVVYLDFSKASDTEVVNKGGWKTGWTSMTEVF